jgi:hypothetical protein
VPTPAQHLRLRLQRLLRASSETVSSWADGLDTEPPPPEPDPLPARPARLADAPDRWLRLVAEHAPHLLDERPGPAAGTAGLLGLDETAGTSATERAAMPEPESPTEPSRTESAPAVAPGAIHPTTAAISEGEPGHAGGAPSPDDGPPPTVPNPQRRRVASTMVRPLAQRSAAPHMTTDLSPTDEPREAPPVDEVRRSPSDVEAESDATPLWPRQAAVEDVDRQMPRAGAHATVAAPQPRQRIVPLRNPTSAPPSAPSAAVDVVRTAEMGAPPQLDIDRRPRPELGTTHPSADAEPHAAWSSSGDITIARATQPLPARLDPAAWPGIAAVAPPRIQSAGSSPSRSRSSEVLVAWRDELDEEQEELGWTTSCSS